MPIDHPPPAPEPSTDGSTSSAAGPPEALRAITGRRSRRRLALLLLPMVIAVAAVGLALGVFFFQYRPDQRTAGAAANEATRAAEDGVVALLSYSADSLDGDFARAKSHLTGEFLDYYNEFTKQILASAAQQNQLTTTAHVIRAAVSEMHPDSAVVLMFVNQNTVSKDKPHPETTASSVLVTLTKVEGSWLIAKFDPV